LAVLIAQFDSITAVPAISRFLGTVIAVFFDDHGMPPISTLATRTRARRFASTPRSRSKPPSAVVSCGSSSRGPSCISHDDRLQIEEA